MLQNINAYSPNATSTEWVFDDPIKGLDKEALILGVDDYLDALCERYHIKRTGGVSVNFSDESRDLWTPAIDHPQATNLIKLVTLKFIGHHAGGHTYLIENDRVLGRNNEALWLCNNLLRYFETPPKRLYITFDEVTVVDVARHIASEAGKTLISANHYDIVQDLIQADQSLDQFSPLLGEWPSVKWSEYYLL